MKNYHLQIYNLGEANMKQMCERRGFLSERMGFLSEREENDDVRGRVLCEREVILCERGNNRVMEK
jgi:hypothetical protein